MFFFVAIYLIYFLNRKNSCLNNVLCSVSFNDLYVVVSKVMCLDWWEMVFRIEFLFKV